MFVRWMILFCCSLAGWSQAAEPALRPSRPSVRVALIEVVEGQLAAWRDQRFPDTYARASGAIQAQFPLEVFVQMVQRGYPPIATNTRADFGGARDDGASAELSVRIHPREGKPLAYRYLLVRERDGWRINGVLVDPSPGTEV